VGTATKLKWFGDHLFDMSDLQEVRENFKRTQESFSKVFPKVDRQLLIDLLLNERQDPNNAPIYTLEVFMKKGTDIEKVRDTILQRTGTIPSIHDGGTHIVATHKVTLDLLKFISENEDVLEITGDYSGGAASTGARHEHRH
jgi:hypothetical protein